MKELRGQGNAHSALEAAEQAYPESELPVTTFGTIPAELAQRLYSDLDAAWPIKSLPKQHCPKSGSSPTTATIAFDYQTTPDLSCAGGKSPKLDALARDAREIVAASR